MVPEPIPVALLRYTECELSPSTTAMFCERAIAAVRLVYSAPG